MARAIWGAGLKPGACAETVSTLCAKKGKCHSRAKKSARFLPERSKKRKAKIENDRAGGPHGPRDNGFDEGRYPRDSQGRGRRTTAEPDRPR